MGADLPKGGRPHEPEAFSFHGITVRFTHKDSVRFVLTGAKTVGDSKFPIQHFVFRLVGANAFACRPLFESVQKGAWIPGAVGFLSCAAYLTT
jgi:hypothetical protein